MTPFNPNLADKIMTVDDVVFLLIMIFACAFIDGFFMEILFYVRRNREQKQELKEKRRLRSGKRGVADARDGKEI